MPALTNGSLARVEPRPAAPLEGEVKHFSVGSAYLREGGLRLDGSNYSDRSFWAQQIASESGYHIATVADLAPGTFTPARFKRLYVDYDNGYPYLSASEILLAKPIPTRFASPQIPGFEQYLVKDGWTLVTDSGTVGRTALVSRTLSRFFVSNNAVRVVPRDSSIAGYIYAYLSSWIGQALLTKDQYGAVIQHIESFHVTKLPVPLLPLPLQRRIHDDIMEAYRLRDEANDLLDQADALLYSELGLPRLDSSQVQYYGGGEVKAFAVSSKTLNLRLDARYSTPVVKLIEENLARVAPKAGFEIRSLEQVTCRVFIPARFKRLYVEEEHGIPFLQGGHIVQFKPFDLKCVSSSLTRDLKSYILERGWTLVTCSGTLGRTALVGSDIAGWAGSQHIMRVIPNTDVVDAGFLYAFLASEYGYWQLVRNRYGAVVDEIAAEQVTDVQVPWPSRALQTRIGALVTTAFEDRAKANKLEDEAIKLLEDTLVEGYRQRTGRKVTLR